MKYSVFLPFIPSRAEQVIPFASMVEWTEISRLWTGQSIRIEPHQTFANLAGNGIRIPLGIGVTLMPLRHPFEAAAQASSLARLTAGPLTVGYGPGAKSFQEMMLGSSYASPLTAVREYLTIVRTLLRGKAVDLDGEYFRFQGQLESGPGPKIEVGAGVLRPRMAQLVGAVADTAITWLTPASYIAEVLRPSLEKGAAEAGQRPPRIVSIVPVALERRGRTSAEVALASNAMHLRLPHYVDMLQKAGVRVSGTGDLNDAAALVDGGAFLAGDVDAIREKMGAYRDAGVDEVVLNFTGVYNKSGQDRALKEMMTVLRGLDVLPPK